MYPANVVMVSSSDRFETARGVPAEGERAQRPSDVHQRHGHDRVQVEVADQPAGRFGMVGVEAGPVLVGDDPPLPHRRGRRDRGEEVVGQPRSGVLDPAGKPRVADPAHAPGVVEQGEPDVRRAQLGLHQLADPLPHVLDGDGVAERLGCGEQRLATVERALQPLLELVAVPAFLARGVPGQPQPQLRRTGLGEAAQQVEVRRPSTARGALSIAHSAPRTLPASSVNGIPA